MGTNYISLHLIVSDMGRKRDAKYYKGKLELVEAREAIKTARKEGRDSVEKAKKAYDKLRGK